jgi:CubicO group peptidase (beta-lactamase class C family)
MLNGEVFATAHGLLSKATGVRLADEHASAAITIGQLMTHTAGFGGDVFTDTGYGDDCVEKYVTSLTGQDQLFLPGEYYSYNNAGFVVLGRVIEVLCGKSFDQCLKEHLIGPLKLTHAATGRTRPSCTGPRLATSAPMRSRSQSRPRSGLCCARRAPLARCSR